MGWEQPAGVAAVKMIDSPHGGGGVEVVGEQGGWGVVGGLNIHLVEGQKIRRQKNNNNNILLPAWVPRHQACVF